MNARIQRGLFVGAFVMSALCAAPAMAAPIDKQEIKSTCSTAGGSYSEGSNYARCQYSNGDSYTCNTDVNQCESCTGGKCTVSARRPGGVPGFPAGNNTRAPAAKSPVSPLAPKPATVPVAPPAKNKAH